MRAATIAGLAPRKRGWTTIRVRGVRVADDLVERRFRPPARNLLWLADITYLRSWEGWLYLGCHPGRLLASDRGLVYGGAHASPARLRRARDAVPRL